MTDPISLVPLPQSVVWSHGTWETNDPWEGLSIGISEELAREEYALAITPRGANLTAGSEAALADGRNTFNQIILASGGSIPCVTISDRPAHAWRGLHLDVARHFFDVSAVKTMIDGMALHRLNVLHLHLTDDQGWRVEIDGYPLLTEVGSRRAQTLVGAMGDSAPEEWVFDGTPHGGFYTQQQLRDLVQYASDRGVMIVPEIDLPGHMQAAIAAYPHLGNNPEQQIAVREVWGISQHVLGVSDEVFEFLRDVLTQVADIFPAPFFHIGGDECPITEWEQSVAARSRLTEWGFTRISEIQGAFTSFATEVLRERGKTVVAWDEVLDTHVPDDVVVMNWRGSDGVKTAVDRGFRTVVASSDQFYFDKAQGDRAAEPLAIGTDVLTLEDVYTAQYAPKGLSAEQEKLILGLQGQLWTEYIATPEHLQYMAFPRLCALAERAWGSPEQPYAQFEERLRGHLHRLEALGIAYRPLD